MERLKAGMEDTLREREEFSERKIKNLEEQKDKGLYFHLATFHFLVPIGLAVLSCVPVFAYIVVICITIVLMTVDK